MLRRIGFLALLVLSGCGRSSLWWLPDLSVADDASVDDASIARDAGRDAAMTHPCATGPLAIMKATPTVMFVLDSSGSMDDPFGPFGSKWTSLTHALADVLPPIDATVAIGALVFPSSTGFGDEGCGVPSSASLVPALDHADALLSLMMATEPTGGTPTFAALEVAGSILPSAQINENAVAIVLATDGEPNCNDDLDPLTCVCSQDVSCGDDPENCVDTPRTVGILAKLYARGIPTYVIGLAATGTAYVNTLNAMAKAGGRPQAGAATLYYSADSDSELQSGLQRIRDQVGACEYFVTDAPTMGDVIITVNGVAVPFDPANGWSWGDIANGEVLLNGTACSAVAGASNLIVTAAAVCNADL